MLILRRKEGQWVELTHKSGDTVRIRVYNIRSRFPGQLDLAFDDPDHLFTIQRPERGMRPAGSDHEAPTEEPIAPTDPGMISLPVTVETDSFSVNTTTSTV